MTGEVVGRAVLKDYPVRLWAESRQHTDELLREFTLMLDGERTGQTDLEVPRSLVELAASFTERFGPLMDEMTSAREAALDAGADRMDSEVALPQGTPDLLAQVRRVLDAVDDYCRNGNLLTLERSAHARRLFDWTYDELVRQYEGGDPTPWPGPW